MTAGPGHDYKGDMMEEQLRIDALEYHLNPSPGKISITPT